MNTLLAAFAGLMVGFFVLFVLALLVRFGGLGFKRGGVSKGPPLRDGEIAARLHRGDGDQ